MSSASASKVENVVRASPRAAETDLEFELLVACTSPFQPGATRELRWHGLDYDRILLLAQHHGVIPQLSAAMEQAAPEVPAAFLQRLREESLKNTRQALWLTRELFRILAQLKARNVDALPYKGPVLAELLYHNVAARQFSDVDILILERDLPIAVAALHELGYEPGIELTPRQERAYLRSGYEYTFDSENGRNLVELQWNVLPKFYSVDLTTQALLERSRVVTFGGQTIRTLSSEDLLIVLCLHAAKHAWAQLSWLSDIARLAQTQPMDWDSVGRTTSSLGIARIVAVTFSLCERLWKEKIPGVLDTGDVHEPILREQLKLLAAGEELDAESIAYFRRMVQVRERRSDRIRFVWRLATTSSVGEWSAIRLPAQLFPLYGAVRVYRLAKRFLTNR